MKRLLEFGLLVLSALVLLGCGTTGETPVPGTEKPAAQSPEPTSRIAQLIRQLGSDDWQKREAAQKTLENWPIDKLGEIDPALREAARTGDLEVRTRVNKIYQEIALHKAHVTLVGTNPQGYKEYRHDITGLVFILLPGGTFQMGSNNGDRNEKPIHKVTVKSFLIAKYPVTQGVWQKIMGTNPSYMKTDDYPVECVFWGTCMNFCQKTGLRLPTEAEWEYACGAGAETNYYWGDDEKSAGDYAWYAGNFGAKETTHPVGQKKPNGFGLFDMNGNVWQWCQDWYGENYYQNSPAENPTGPAEGKVKVTRGGCYSDQIRNLRITARCSEGWPGGGVGVASDIVGFRPALSKE